MAKKLVCFFTPHSVYKNSLLHELPILTNILKFKQKLLAFKI